MEENLALGIGVIAIIIYVIIMLGILILTAIVWWRITAKTGNSGCLGLLIFVPVANLVLLLILAFSAWPIERELEQLREQLRGKTKEKEPQKEKPTNVFGEKPR